jgi:ribosomal protein S18 acetylase RimI-like enzyme
LGTIKDTAGQEIVVASLLALGHTDELAWIGCYIVDKAHRGKGYGIKLFQHGLDHLKGHRYIGLGAVLSVVPAYERSGFKQSWLCKTFRGDMVKDVLAKLSPDDYQNVAVTDWTDDDSIQDLARLEQRCTGYYRPVFWKQWIRMHTGPTRTGDCARNHGRLAAKVLDQHGKLAHFASLRPAVKGFALVLYSQDPHAAEALLRYVVQSVVDGSSSAHWSLPKNHYMALDANGCGDNPASFALYEKLGFNVVTTHRRMYHDAYPTGDLSGLFSAASLTIG